MRVFLILVTMASLMASEADPISLVLAEDGTATLTNGSGVAIHYQGYAADSPIFSRESWHGASWAAEPVGWCGTGLAQQSLEPGEQVSFTAHPPAESVRWRLVMTVQRAEGEAQLYSNPVNVDMRQFQR